jgi:hypothetical protein
MVIEEEERHPVEREKRRKPTLPLTGMALFAAMLPVRLGRTSTIASDEAARRRCACPYEEENLWFKVQRGWGGVGEI